MDDNDGLDERILLMRIAVIDATFERLRYVRSPERVSLLVRNGWSNAAIFDQITSEQPLSVKVRSRIDQLSKGVSRSRNVLAFLAVFLTSAYLGREAIITIIGTIVEAAQSKFAATSDALDDGSLKPETFD